MNVQFGERRMQRTTHGAMVYGVAAALGAYLGVDPFLFRLAFLVTTLAGGLGALLYLVLALSMPRVEAEPLTKTEPVTVDRENEPKPPFRPLRGVSPPGIFFIGFGLLALVVELKAFDWLTWATACPFLVILLGAALVLGREE